MKKITITVITLFLINTAFSQQWSIGGRFGLGNYSMNGLKDLQEFRIEESELPLSTTDNYPITPNYRVELAINDLSFIDKIGIFYAFNSTGARSTRSDYSGRVDLDAVVNGNQMGFTFQKIFQKKSKVSSGLYLDASYLLSSLKTKDYLKIDASPDIIQENNYNFNSRGIAAEFGMVAKYQFNPLELQLTLGYLYDFSGKLFLDGNKDQWLAINNSEVKTDWSGIRLGIQISYLLKKKTDK